MLHCLAFQQKLWEEYLPLLTSGCCSAAGCYRRRNGDDCVLQVNLTRFAFAQNLSACVNTTRYSYVMSLGCPASSAACDGRRGVHAERA